MLVLTKDPKLDLQIKDLNGDWHEEKNNIEGAFI